MTEVLIAIAAIAVVAMLVTIVLRARKEQKEEEKKVVPRKIVTQVETLRERDAQALRSLNGSASGASSMKPKVTHTSRHSAPSRPSVSRSRRDDSDIITNPLHPLNPITDPFDVYGSSDSVRESRPEPTPEPTRYTEPSGSYSFSGSSDSGSSYSGSSDSGSSYSSSDSSSSSSSGGSFD